MPTDTSSSDFSMFELFRVEADTHSATLTEGLMEIEQGAEPTTHLESLMRAAHSIKGAAKLVGAESACLVAHAMEDCFVAAQEGKFSIAEQHVDILLQGVDILKEISEIPEDGQPEWAENNTDKLKSLVARFAAMRAGEIIEEDKSIRTGTSSTKDVPSDETEKANNDPGNMPISANQTLPAEDRSLRVSADRLNRLMGIAGESRVEARWIRSHADSLHQIKRQQTDLVTLIDELHSALDGLHLDEISQNILFSTEKKADDCRQLISDRISDLEEYDRRVTNLAERLNREVVASRMRPFSDITQGFQRMARDLSRSMGKNIRLEITGKTTQVDRDILSKLDAPITHMLRNAIDHGIETVEERLAAGKRARGKIKLEALHHGGVLNIIVSDDGRGVELDKVRDKAINRGLVNKNMASDLSESEILDFLFLPGFTTRKEVSEISGRGVGMDIVHTMVQETHGNLRASSTLGNGLRIHLQLPLTLSLMRCLLVEIASDYYAIPLARIEHVRNISPEDISTMEDHQYFEFNGENIGLVDTVDVLSLHDKSNIGDNYPVIIIGDRTSKYAIIVDKLHGESELSVCPIDKRLGKVQDISATALMEDGSPVLIIDVDDMIRTIDNLNTDAKRGRARNISVEQAASIKRILVIDDSITVREVERKLLESRGYHVDVAVDGIDGWNTLRTGNYSLVITDIDMPRMNGIELTENIKQDPNYRSIPVMIVSYKDRPEDREKGLQVGADYYLTKGSFHDDSLLQAVADLIGEI
ncbi:MAG: Wsp signal transduction system sensor histidine kinase WspE [Gammaproteobacteria bacterium]|nr:MAG: Wsp signal transduction system sensor histidine kinase WspE [Gammaproteobacteria bacterium]